MSVWLIQWLEKMTLTIQTLEIVENLIFDHFCILWIERKLDLSHVIKFIKTSSDIFRHIVKLLVKMESVNQFSYLYLVYWLSCKIE